MPGSETDQSPATQFEVAQPPNDAITAIVFAPDFPNRFLVSSWDKNVYLYEVIDGAEQANLIKKFEHRAPVLDVCFGATHEEAFTAGLDQQVSRCVPFPCTFGVRHMCLTETSP